MIHLDQSADPAVHELCIRIARKCIDVVRPLLRQEEVRECLRGMYQAAKEEIEKKPVRESEV